jgi:RNA polymerase-binding transcription factor DksA
MGDVAGTNFQRRGQMDAVYFDKLRDRRTEIETTLRHLDIQRRDVEESTDWMNRAAYEGRIHLLASLSAWYQDETDQIERALERRDASLYSLCFECHEPIGRELLETDPNAQFCFDCQES